MGNLHVICPQSPRLRDPEMSNRQRVFADTMQEGPSETIVRGALREALSSRLRSKSFMNAFQKAKPMGVEEKIAHLGKHKTDYPGLAFCFSVEKRPICSEGRHEAYWLEIKDDATAANGAMRRYSLLILAEAKGVAIAKKWLFSLRFSDALIQVAKVLDSVAPESTINVNYHLAREDGKPHEIAEILLYGSNGADYGILKICIGDMFQKRKRWIGKKEISGTLFLALEGRMLDKTKMANLSRKFEKSLDAMFNQMEGLVREIAQPGIADWLEVYRCLKQVQL